MLVRTYSLTAALKRLEHSDARGMRVLPAAPLARPRFLALRRAEVHMYFPCTPSSSVAPRLLQ